MKDVQNINEDTTWLAKHGGYSKDMTLRDYFAAKAMQEYCKEFNDDAHLARVAYQIADAMLKERGKK